MEPLIRFTLVQITGYCLAATLNVLVKNVGHEQAVATLNAVSESLGFEIASTNQADFTTGQALFREHHGLSFVDAVAVAYLQRSDGEYCYSFDDDFDAIPTVTRLDAAVDPRA